MARSKDRWHLEIPNVRINVSHPISVSVLLSPGEKVMLDSNPLLTPGLTDAYREGIERGEITLFSVLDYV